jgi:broad specificity phosphatase PhoE
MKIYFIRHGESESDVKEKYDGDYDDHLTPLGIQQAEELATSELLQDIEKIYTSPKIRAQETASVLQNKLGNIPVEVIEGLAEQDIYGAFLELGKDQPEEEYRKLGEVLVNKDVAYDGAETYWDFKDRILKSISELLNAPQKNFAVITHGGPIRCLFRELIKTHEIDSIGNGAIIEVQVDNSGKMSVGKTTNIRLKEKSN